MVVFVRPSVSGEVYRDDNTHFTFQLREQMLTKMSTVLLDSPSNTTNQVEVTARAVAGLTQRPEELTPTAQVLQKWNVQFH